MGKISELDPPPGPITGAEKIPVVQGAGTWGLPLGEFLDDTVAAATAAAVAARDEAVAAVAGIDDKVTEVEDAAAAATDAVAAAGAAQVGLVNAAGAIQTGLAAAEATRSETAAAQSIASTIIPLELSNHLLAQVAQVAITRPNLVTAETIEFWGDSTGQGVGTSTSPTNYSFPSQLGATITGGGGINNNSAGGTTSTQTLASATAASATVKGRHFVISTGLNDLDTLVGNRRDWSFSGFTKGNIAAIKALQTGGKQMAMILCLRPNYSLPGMKGGADNTHHNRDMIATYGADAINAARYMRFVSDRVGPDYWNVRTANGTPLSKQGQSTNLIGINNAPFLTNAGAFADLSADDGQIGWNSTSLRWERKIGASGAGSWAAVDGKHYSRWGYADIAQITGDWLRAVLGIGAPFAPPQEFRCAFDIAAGALVGQVAIRTAASAFGSAAKAEIVAGNDDFVFDIDPFGRIRRSRRGTLKRQIYTLVIRLTGSNGFASLGIVDIFVGRASTQLLPQKLLIPSPVSLCGMEGNALSNAGKVFSGAAWINVSNGSTTPFIYSWPKGAAGSNAIMHARLTWDSATLTNRLQLSAANDAGTNILLATSRSQNQGGQGIPQNTWGWLTWAANLATGTVIANWNDNPLSFTGTGATLTYTDTAIPLGNMSPGAFLNGRTLDGFDRTGSTPLIGGCGYGAIWDEFIDWSSAPIRRQLFNADGTPAITNTTGTIDGKASKMVWLQGEPVDLAWGGFNPNQLVQINRDALSTMSIV